MANQRQKSVDKKALAKGAGAAGNLDDLKRQGDTHAVLDAMQWHQAGAHD